MNAAAEATAAEPGLKPADPDPAAGAICAEPERSQCARSGLARSRGKTRRAAGAEALRRADCGGLPFSQAFADTCVVENVGLFYFMACLQTDLSTLFPCFLEKLPSLVFGNDDSRGWQSQRLLQGFWIAYLLQKTLLPL